jgi:ABC-type branched-subunit amino acid transport system ATPase component
MPESRAMRATAPWALEVEALTVRFRGATAVDGVSLHAPVGRITGLIGPNGAGKTTTFNACCGLVRPAAGRIRLGPDDVTSAAPQHRARLGLGRTFQRMELFDALTVRRNVALGREARMAGASPVRHLVCSRTRRADVAAATDDALVRCGLEPLADRRVGTLSTGQRRLVELARTVAGGFRLVLLDEPSSGLDHGETAAFGALLASLVDAKGLGILLVEHDMSLVMGICAHLFVLDFGQLIFEGSPAEARASDLVRHAYLGAA